MSVMLLIMSDVGGIASSIPIRGKINDGGIGEKKTD